MSVLNYLRQSGRRQARPLRLHLEALENRTLPSGLTLSPSEAAPQLVGERIVWTASATDLGANPVYQFRVGPEDGPLHVLRDFSPANNFTWTPMQEGTYDVEVIAKQGFQATDTESADVFDLVNSRVTGTDAVITPTLNPLVALYSVPPTQPGPGPHGTVHVEFSVAGDQPSWRSTNELPSLPGESTNFFVAGMLPNTTYEMRHVFSDGSSSSPELFTTGSIPSTLTFPTLTVVQPPGPQSDVDQDLVYHSLSLSPLSSQSNPFATDLQGRVVWYYDLQQSSLGINNMNTGTLVPGGTVLGLGIDRYSVPNQYGVRPRNVLREINLAGDPVRETNLAAVNAQLAAMGHYPIYGFFIDVQRLPDGSTVTQGVSERTVEINGTPTNYVGTMLLVLDQNFQVTWAWDAFDHLDVNRGPVLGEIVQPGTPVTSVVPNLPAVEWLHNNAVAWSPADGNLIISARMQDWVIKINYGNGQGDGHVVWRLGKDGDFTVNSTDPNPWFSHQHNVHYIDDSTLILFDNGNTRRATDPNADSRGQVWKLDEQTMTATLLVNIDLGNYSSALGAAQRLSNGNFSFTSGFQGQPPNQFGQTIEVLPDGTKAYVLEVNKIEFRSYRMRTLYGGVSDAQDPQPEPGLAETSAGELADTASAIVPVSPDSATLATETFVSSGADWTAAIASAAASSLLPPDGSAAQGAVSASDPLADIPGSEGGASGNGFWDATSPANATNLQAALWPLLLPQQGAALSDSLDNYSWMTFVAEADFAVLPADPVF
jgi:hypothetical protein